MEKGVMVEFGSAEQVFNNPKHEYTKKLLNAAPGQNWTPPRLEPDEAARIAKELEVV
jgi:peptide/nickel transport system ATP-binding protein